MPVEVTTLLPFDTKLVCGLCGAPAALRRPDNSVWCATGVTSPSGPSLIRPRPTETVTGRGWRPSHSTTRHGRGRG